MKPYPALATLEFSELPTGMHATDALVKKAPIAVLKCGAISRGRYMTLIGGTTASVEEAYGEGLYHGRNALLDHVFLPDVHSAVHDAVLGKRLPCGEGAVAILESPTSSSIIRAAELALKGTGVNLIEIRLADSLLHGKGITIFNGELHDIEAAVDIAALFLDSKQIELTHKIITRPNEFLAAHISLGTNFHAAPFMETDGEGY
jgi:microcompartment protein CcmL/EutN